MLPVSTRWTEALKELVRTQVYQRDVCNEQIPVGAPFLLQRQT